MEPKKGNPLGATIPSMPSAMMPNPIQGVVPPQGGTNPMIDQIVAMAQQLQPDELQQLLDQLNQM